jgi:hypothetical protein
MLSFCLIAVLQQIDAGHKYNYPRIQAFLYTPKLYQVSENTHFFEWLTLRVGQFSA